MQHDQLHLDCGPGPEEGGHRHEEEAPDHEDNVVKQGSLGVGADVRICGAVYELAALFV